jgi:hypothetical protein
MTKGNYKAGADRGNKLEKQRGLRGSHFGPAGPVKHIDPATIGPVDPPKVSREYALYLKCEKRAGRTPKSHADWLKGLTKRARAKQTVSAAVRKHQFRPYTDTTSAERFEQIERRFRRD